MINVLKGKEDGMKIGGRAMKGGDRDVFYRR